MDAYAGDGKTVHLHIGTMKTGTSYVQGNLEQARRGLADDGVLYPGSVGAAVHEVLEKHGARHFGDTSGAWDQLAATVRAWDGRSAVLSMEFLTLATTEQARRIVDSLRPADVRVVLTVRDLARTVTSAWQQTTKNRQTVSWPDFLAAVTSDDTPSRTHEMFWRHHDVPAIARTWGEVVRLDHVTVLTLPARGAPPEVLWDRFCTAVGLDPARYPASDSSRSNSSLGYAEAEMMRRLNVALGREVDQATYRRLVTGFISRQVLRRGSDSSPPPRLPAPVHAWSVERSREVVRRLDGLGLPVVGDLDELVPAPLPPVPTGENGAPTEADAVDESAVAAVAARTVAALVTLMAEGGGDAAGEGSSDEDVETLDVGSGPDDPAGTAGTAGRGRRGGGGQGRRDPDAQDARREARRAERRAARQAARRSSGGGQPGTV